MLTKNHKLKISKSMIGKNKGKVFTSEHKKKISEARKKYLINPKNHGKWKGKNASYRAIHGFIIRHFGKADICEDCGEKEKRIHWANTNHKYNRNRKYWKKLCPKCHGKFDKINNLRIRK